MPASTIPHPPSPAVALPMAAFPLPDAWERGAGARGRALTRARDFGDAGFTLSHAMVEYGALPATPRGILADAHILEVIPDLCHPYADVEWEEGTVAGSNWRLTPEEAIDTVRNCAATILGCKWDNKPAVEIMTASGDKGTAFKHSFHIVWPGSVLDKAGVAAFGKQLVDMTAKRFSAYRMNPVDASVYTPNHLMRALYQTKANEPGRPFTPYGSSKDFADHLIGVYTGARELTWNAPIVEAPAPAPVVARAVIEDSPETMDFITQSAAMLNVGRADTYDTWAAACWLFKSLGFRTGNHDALEAIWTAFSAKSPKHDAAATAKKWDEARDEGFGFKTLREWANADDPERFAALSRARGREYHAKREAEEAEAAEDVDIAAAFAGLGLGARVDGPAELPAAPGMEVVPIDPVAAKAAKRAELEQAKADKAEQMAAKRALMLAREVCAAAKKAAKAAEETGAIDALIAEIAQDGPARADDGELVRLIDALGASKDAFSNQAVADALECMTRGQLAHVNDKTWYMWNDRAWKQVNDVNIHPLFKQLRKRIIARMAALRPDDGAALLVSRIGKSIAKLESTDFSNASITKLKSLTSDCLFAAKLDANPDLIGFDDGVYDLRTAEFHAPRASDFVSRTVGYDFPGLVDDDVYAPKVDETLRSIFDPALLEFVMRVYAEQASGHLRFEQFYILTGRGGNGKGILQALLMTAFGMAEARGYFYSVKQSMWTGKEMGNGEGASPARAALRGVRMTFSGEPEAGSKLQAGAIKSVTGRDPIAARELYGAPFSFTPQCDVNVMCNDIPDLSAIDGGMIRRLNIIKFKYSFVDEEKVAADTTGMLRIVDTPLKGLIMTDRGYGQAFMRMLLRVYEANKGARSIPAPPEVLAATAAFLVDTDPVGAWFGEKYEITGNGAHRISAKDLFNAYHADTGNRALQLHVFGREFKRVFGVTPENEKDKVVKAHGVMKYVGIQRIPEEEEEEGED